jgi:3',5'-cyclic-AMP phosphodiesterase
MGGAHRSQVAKRPIWVLLGVVACLFCLPGCELFEFSPYQSNVEAEDLTHKNLERIAALDLAPGAPFKFAVISDSHTDYTTLSNWVHRINERDDLAFALHLGDQTDHGLKREYGWTRDVMRHLVIPHLFVLGNHDSLSNGAEIYRGLYGPYNHAFELGGVQLVIFNDNAWEFDQGVPDFDWLTAQLRRVGPAQRFVCAHVPPFGVQMNPQERVTYRQFMRTHGVDLSLHGHIHQHYDGQRYGDGVLYLAVDDLPDRSYVVVSVGGGTFSTSRVHF